MNEHLAARGVETLLQPYAPVGDAQPTHPSALEKWLTHNLYQHFLHDGAEPMSSGALTPPPIVAAPAITEKGEGRAA